jgi:hypothetical protein
MPSWTVREPRNIEFTAEDMRYLDVRLTVGRLSVVGTDGPPRVEISKVGTLPIQVNSADRTVTVAHESARIWRGVLTPVWWWLNSQQKFGCDVSVAVPYDTSCTLWLASGSLVVSTVRSDVAADVISGRLTLLGVDGELRAKVVSGPIDALGCAGVLTLETVSGEIILADTAASRLRAKTVSGALTADLDNPPYDSRIDLETVSGEITIRVREDSDLKVRMNAAHGRVTSDFPGLSIVGKWGASASGNLGLGSGRLNASAVGGNVALLRRPVDDTDFSHSDVPVSDAS